MLLILMYLGAIVAANLSVATFGASVTIINAFVFIAFDLTVRDALHDRWNRRNLWRKMLLLILAGSVLSALINANAIPIAVASFVAFAVAGLADAFTYQLLGDKSRLVRINGSNVISAAVDSLIFPMIAFGFRFMWGIVVGQFCAKVVGGFIWSLVLKSRKVRTPIGWFK